MITHFFKPTLVSGQPTTALVSSVSGPEVARKEQGKKRSVQAQQDEDVRLPENDVEISRKKGKLENVLPQGIIPSKNGIPIHLPSVRSDDTCVNNRVLAERTERSILLRTERTHMEQDWFSAFEKEFEKSYFLNIKRTLMKEWTNGKTIYPVESEIYSFTKCPLDDIRVVILGQDPYHNPNQAHGLCFSVKKGVPPPPSLLNIYRELESDLGPNGFSRPNHGCLEAWVQEGVLLLNASLTVRKNEPNSHSTIGWTKFTDAIVTYLNKRKQGLVFMLWGGYAQKKGAAIDPKRHLVLKATHPSPLGANKGGWFGCKHFSKANAYLESSKKKPINWNSISSSD